MNPWFGIAFVLLALGVCFLVLRQLGKWLCPHPEILRKVMHVFMGLIAASFPLLFHEFWPVLILSLISLPALLFIRCGSAGSLQNVLHGVQRNSWGELLFPVAIALLFYLADGNAILYSLPILILALADAVAALIGVFYGRMKYTTLEGYKSIEGSVSFLFVTFLVVHIGLLLFTDTGRLESLLIAALMGIIIMLLEAIAWRGLDNIFIPLSSFALLKVYLDSTPEELIIKLLVIIILGLFIFFWRRRSTLDDSALLAALLVGYTSWALAGIYWLLVPLLMFVTATVLACRDCDDATDIRHSVIAALTFSLPGFACLFIYTVNRTPDLFYPFVLSYGAQLVMLGLSRIHLGKEQISSKQVFLWAVIPGFLITMLPVSLNYGINIQLVSASVISLSLMIAVALIFWRTQPQLSNCPIDNKRWIRQGSIAASASLLGWILSFIMENNSNAYY